MQEGKIHFAQSMKERVEESFLKVRYDKNGEPDLSTIDGFVRSTALVAEHFDHRTKMKEAISLQDVL